MSDRARHLIALGRPAEALTELAKNFDAEDPQHWWLRGLALFFLWLPSANLSKKSWTS